MTEREQLEKLEQDLREARHVRITECIDRCIAERRIQAAYRDRWIERCLKDETILKELQEMPPHRDEEPVILYG